MTEVNFSKAQLKHFRELQATARQAQEELQTFVNYLTEEHELDMTKPWTLGPNGFVEQTPPGKSAETE